MLNLMQRFQMLQSNPLMQRAMKMAEGKSEQELKDIAFNLAKERGMDLNNLSALLNQFGLRL